MKCRQMISKITVRRFTAPLSAEGITGVQYLTKSTLPTTSDNGQEGRCVRVHLPGCPGPAGKSCTVELL